MLVIVLEMIVSLLLAGLVFAGIGVLINGAVEFYGLLLILFQGNNLALNLTLLTVLFLMAILFCNVNIQQLDIDEIEDNNEDNDIE